MTFATLVTSNVIVQLRSGPARALKAWTPHTETSGHQRKSFCVKLLVGAPAIVCPCIAMMGLVPAACNRVEETTGRGCP